VIDTKVLRWLRRRVNGFISIVMKGPSEQEVKRKTGRPLSFDRGEALERAMRLFWRHGYEATSLADLTEAMGVSAPSVYAAFGDKKRLFLEAVDQYLRASIASARILDETPSAREAAFQLMRQSAIDFTGEDTPPGCLLATGAISCSTEAADLQMHLADIRKGFEEKLAGRIAHAVAAKELPPGTDVPGLAAHVIAVIQGMSTLARDGAPREKLLRIAETAMTAWPPETRGASNGA
jgi:AcrR family transcriptional regulator